MPVLTGTIQIISKTNIFLEVVAFVINTFFVGIY